MLPPISFFTCGNSLNILRDTHLFTLSMISDGEKFGGADTRICTWSLLTTPRNMQIVHMFGKPNHEHELQHLHAIRDNGISFPIQNVYSILYLV